MAKMSCDKTCGVGLPRVLLAVWAFLVLLPLLAGGSELHEFVSLGDRIHRWRANPSRSSRLTQHRLFQRQSVPPGTNEVEDLVKAAAAGKGEAVHGEYVIGFLRQGSSLKDVYEFVGHDDVHLLASIDDGPDQSRVHGQPVLVYHTAGGNGAGSWVQRALLLSGDKKKTPFADGQIFEVPLPAVSHLSAELWPNACGLLRQRHSESSNASVVAMEDVVVWLSKKAVSVHGTEVLRSNISSVLLQNLARSGTCSGSILPMVNSRRRSATDLGRGDDGSSLRIRLTVRGMAAFDVEHRRRPIACACADVLAALSSTSFVRWVEPKPTFKTLNYVATITMQNPSLVGGQTHTLWEKGITGSGQLIAVGDTGLDFDSCFFNDATSQVSFWPRTNPNHRKILSYQECIDEGVDPDHEDRWGAHGTHVAGSAVGNSLGGKAEYNGMAKDALLFFQDLTCKGETGLAVPPDLQDYYQPAYDLGVRVSSNSWGTEGSPKSYSATDRLSDAFLYEHQSFLVVYAAGNVALEGVLTPGASKNSLTVGAHMNSFAASQREQITGFSAHGPTFDQRIKPDITGPGDSVISALSDGLTNSFQCSTTSKMGTSMATPHVAGGAVMLRQYLQEGRMPYGYRNASASISNPSAALMKALLIHAAVPMSTGGGVPPNGVQGFGRIELNHVMWTAAADDDDSDAATSAQQPLFRWHKENLLMQHGATQEYCFTTDSTATSPISFARATAAWIDSAAAFEGSSKSLVNDIDLAIVDADGAVYRGNRPTDDTSGEFDHVNNVEQITITSATSLPSVSASGRRLFRVVAHGFDIRDAVRYGGQPFALVVWAPGIVEVDCAASGTDATKCANACSGIGLCTRASAAAVPTCVCPATHHHIDCSQCNASTVCHSSGTCSFSGDCTCSSSGHFDLASSRDCGVCAAGWHGAHCDNDCTCSAHGACDERGQCVCWTPASSIEGSCYDGASCGTCCPDFGGASCAAVSFWCHNRQVRVINGTLPSTPHSAMIQVNGYGVYDNSNFCSWDLIAPAVGWRVQITFNEFAVETPYDYVHIYDGVVGSGAADFGRFTGHSLEGVTKVSTGRRLQVTFFADMIGNDKGFTATYVFLPPPSVEQQTTGTTTTLTVAPLTTTTTTLAPTATAMASLIVTDAPAVSTAGPLTTTAEPTTTTAPISSTQLPVVECVTVSDCLNNAIACNDRGRCVCRPFFTGWRCRLQCPTVRDRFGSSVTCNGKGVCTSGGDTAVDSNNSNAARCMNCEAPFTGYACQLDLSSGIATDEQGRRGRMIRAVEDLGYLSNGSAFPLSEATLPLGPLTVNVTHFVSVRVPLPPSIPAAAREWLLQDTTAMRVWVLQPNEDSVQPRIMAWGGLEDSGSMDTSLPRGQDGSLATDCIDVVTAAAASSSELQASETFWFDAVLGIRPVSLNTSISSARGWLLRLSPHLSGVSQRPAHIDGPTVVSCASDATFLAQRQKESTGYTTTVIATDRPVVTVVVRVENVSHTGSVAAAFENHDKLFKSIGSGFLVGVAVGCALLGRFMMQHRGFRPIRPDGVDARSDVARSASAKRRHEANDAFSDDSEMVEELDTLEDHNNAAPVVVAPHTQLQLPPQRKGPPARNMGVAVDDADEDELFPISSSGVVQVRI